MIPSVALDPPLVAILALTGAAAGGLGLALAALGLQRVRRLGRRLDAEAARTHAGGRGHDGRTNGTARHAGKGSTAGSVDLRTELTDTTGAADASGPTNAPADAIRNVAVVRYDAFPGIGGQMSFSAALLDDAGDGLVLTVINGRNEARTYAKDIRDGTSVHRLSEDEVEAIDQALSRTRAP